MCLNSNMMKVLLSILSFFSFSSVAYAAAKPQTFDDVLGILSDKILINLIPVIVAVGLVTFLAGVVRFVGAGDDEEKRSSGKKIMVFGIVVLFIMMTFWGFVGLFTKSFFGTGPSIPNYLPMGN